MTTRLILDCNNLAWRGFYAMGELSHKETPTGIAYCIFRDLVALADLHNSTNFVFTFDLGESFRTNICSTYKFKRTENTLGEEGWALKKEVNKQIRLLRTEYLVSCGFKNILYKDHYEADDIIASVVQTLPPDEDAILVSTDKDLYQLLNERVRIWDPRKSKMITQQSFQRDKGILPSKWAKVKAIAGCVSDNVPGVDGVGEKTAIKYLLGTLKEDSKMFSRIEKEWGEVIKRLAVVKLPYFGTPTFSLVKDKVSRARWTEVMDDLGIRSLRGLAPVPRGM